MSLYVGPCPEAPWPNTRGWQWQHFMATRNSRQPECRNIMAMPPRQQIAWVRHTLSPGQEYFTADCAALFHVTRDKALWIMRLALTQGVVALRTETVGGRETFYWRLTDSL